MQLILYDLMVGLGQSFVFWLVALVISLSVKKPIPFYVCFTVPVLACVILWWIIKPIDYYGLACAYILPFVFLFALSRRKRKQDSSPAKGKE